MAAPPSKPVRKQKETKNMEWNSTARRFGILKESFLQKVGSTEGKIVPSQFTDLTARVKLLKGFVVELIDRIKTMNKSIASYTQATASLATALAEFAGFLPADDVLAPALVKYQEVQNDIEAQRNIYKDVLISSVIGSLEKFQLDEFHTFKDLKKAWQKSRLEHDAAKAKLDDTLKAKNNNDPDALRYLRAQLHYAQARKREAMRFEAALDKASDVLWRRDFALLQESVVWMQALAKFLDASHQTLAQLEEYYQQLKDHTVQRKQEWTAFKETRKQEREQRLLAEHAVRYTPLVELLSNEDLALVNAVCVTAGSEQEVVLESLIHILDAHKMTLPIIKLGITREVEKTKQASTLFRGNTMATKLMTAFTKMTGRVYITNTLKPCMDAFADMLKQGGSVDVNPDDVGPDQAAKNIETLLKSCTNFLTAILESISKCPVPFRVMAAHLREEVSKSYPEAKYTAVGGFIFLRFFCPAILSPETMNPPLLSSVDPVLRKALIVISKCLQNLANGIEFGVKEPHLAPINSTFIKAYDAPVKQFFDDLATAPASEDYEPLCSVENAIARELPNLHSKIIQNLSKIGTSLQQYKQEETIPALCLILAELGEEGLALTIPEKKKDKKK